MSKRSSKPATMTLKNFTVVSVPERENNDGTVTPTTYHIMSLHTHRCVATAASFQQACEWVGDFNVGIDPRDAK
jgi:archaellum component FlaG (FlaF/FlaG flagellin family)